MNIKVIEGNGKLMCQKHSNQELIGLIRDKSVPFQDAQLCTICLSNQRTELNKLLSIDAAKQIIQEKYQRRFQECQRTKELYLSDILLIQQKVQDIESFLVKGIKEIFGILKLWIDELKLQEEKTHTITVQDLQQLYFNNFDDHSFIDNAENYSKKLETIIKGMLNNDDLKKCLKQVLEIPKQQEQQNLLLNCDKEDQKLYKSQIVPKDKTSKQALIMLNQVKQQERCNAIAFNFDSSLLAAGFKDDIKIWSFDKGQLREQDRLKGHQDGVYCLVFSKYQKCLISGSQDKTIIIWKQLEQKWIQYQSNQEHNDWISCIILNKQEDELISCSWDKSIKVWNYDTNQLIYNYTLEQKHKKEVYSLSLNMSEDYLASCGEDGQIILWQKGKDKKWIYKNNVQNEDFGFRLCFINDSQIIWQSSNINLTKFFNISNEQLEEIPELKIQLSECANEDKWMFPFIFNQKKQIIILKHKDYVYIIRQQGNQQFALEKEKINCQTSCASGTLSTNSEYLIIWDEFSKEFRVYLLNFQ